MATVTAVDQEKIQAGADALLALHYRIPHQTVEYIDNLRNNRGWSQAEITQLLVRVFEMLLERCTNQLDRR